MSVMESPWNSNLLPLLKLGRGQPYPLLTASSLHEGFATGLAITPSSAADRPTPVATSITTNTIDLFTNFICAIRRRHGMAPIDLDVWARNAFRGQSWPAPMAPANPRQTGIGILIFGDARRVLAVTKFKRHIPSRVIRVTGRNGITHAKVWRRRFPAVSALGK